MTEIFLLDSWAVLASLKKESPADSRVRTLLKQASLRTTRLLLSVIHLGEVDYRAGRVRGKHFAENILAELRSMPIEIMPADETSVIAAARWKMKYRISYADAFAAATSVAYKATLVTGDPELVALAGELKIERLKRGV
ncbi:MAG: type II toxin-antitoxin system VapC family toxin [Chloroflexi bacterium]|nr:type II toxin-antitoxin system VapC family toxin [Chloroflexota bacterium]